MTIVTTVEELTRQWSDIDRALEFLEVTMKPWIGEVTPLHDEGICDTELQSFLSEHHKLIVAYRKQRRHILKRFQDVITTGDQVMVMHNGARKNVTISDILREELPEEMGQHEKTIGYNVRDRRFYVNAVSVFPPMAGL